MARHIIKFIESRNENETHKERKANNVESRATEKELNSKLAVLVIDGLRRERREKAHLASERAKERAAHCIQRPLLALRPNRKSPGHV